MKTIVQLVLIDETGDSYYRMRWPGRALCEQDKDVCLINLDARASERFSLAEEADLLVLFQSNDLDLIPIIEKRRKAGKKTLVEYNDNFYAPPPASPVYGPWSKPNIWQTYETIMNRADHLIVTGQGLKALLANKTSCEITILENHIYESCASFNECWEDTDEIRIGWAGSVGHMSDLIAILPILEKFASENDNVKLYLMGNESIPNYCKLPKDKFVFSNWGTMSDYYDFLKKIHVGIAPLADSPYNHCRSDIKAIEFASRGVLPIIQNLTPYKKLIASGSFLNFSNFEELIRTLSNLVSNKSGIKAQAKKCFDYVNNHRLALQNTERKELYLSNINKSKKPKKSVFQSYQTGYHEVLGTANTELECLKVVTDCQLLLKENRYNDVIENIKANKEILGYEPNSNLILAEAMRHSSLDDALEILQDGASRFPLDLRFKLRQLKLHKTTTEKTARWINLIDQLSREDSHYRNFYEQLVVPQYLKDLADNLIPLETTTKIVEIFPNNFEILFGVGEFLLKERRYNESHSILTSAQNLYRLKNSSANISDDGTNKILLTLIEAADYSRRM